MEVSDTEHSQIRVVNALLCVCGGVSVLFDCITKMEVSLKMSQKLIQVRVVKPVFSDDHPLSPPPPQEYLEDQKYRDEEDLAEKLESLKSKQKQSSSQ